MTSRPQPSQLDPSSMSNYRREPVPNINYVRNLSPPKPKTTKKRRLKSKSVVQSRSRKPSVVPIPATVLHRRVPKPSNSDQSINEVLDIAEDGTARDNIRVLVRIRPKTAKERATKEARTIVKFIDYQTVMFDQKEDIEEFFFHGVKQKELNFIKRRNKDLTFGFDYVFSPSHSNVEIFDNALKNIVGHVLLGYNCSVFAYGATGSGKTYTMLGSSENPGLTFLMAKELSRKIQEMSNEYESEIVVSYLEIYNETLKDLLSPTANLSIREDGLQGVNIPNLSKHKIQETSELLSMLSQGNSVRTQHPTDHNAESSRSHAMFQIFVELRRRITHSHNYKTQKAKLVMVDLAGSERGATNAKDNARCREGANINKSLLALGNCINALADGKKTHHVPYRNSKLTRLLKDSLGGNCKTLMIANVAPTILNYDDTYNTLKYADRAKEIRVNCKKNVSLEPTGNAECQKLIRELQMELSVLRTELQKQKDINMNSKAMQELEKYNLSLDYISSNTSNFVAPVQKIHDPTAMEEFIQVIGQKKKLEENLVEASINGKEAAWLMLWKQWRIQSVGVFGKSESETFIGSLERLRHQHENLTSKYHQCKDKIHLERKLVHYNDKEIDLARKNFLSNLKMEDPFLTLTLREFLYYKGLEREVGTHKCVENHHQKMCTLIFEELVNSEYILTESLRFNQFLCRGLTENRVPVPLRDKKYKLLIATLYGDRRRLANEATERRLRSQGFSEELVHQLRQVIHNPVVEYEAPAIEDGSSDRKDPHDAIDCSVTSITPMIGSQISIGSSSSVPTDAASSQSDIVSVQIARRSISEFIQQTKTVAPPSHQHLSQQQARPPSSYKGSDSDCHSEPFSFTSRNYTNTGKSNSGTSLEPMPGHRAHFVQSVASDTSLKVTTKDPIPIDNSSGSSSTSVDGLLMTLHSNSKTNFSNNSGESEEESHFPLKRVHAGPNLFQQISSRTKKPSPRKIFQLPEKIKPRGMISVPVTERTKPGHQLPELDISPRHLHQHQPELADLNTRKRKGGEGSGDYDDNAMTHGCSLGSVPNGEEDSAIIGPPAAFADSCQSSRSSKARPKTYELLKPSFTQIPNIVSETEDGSEEEII